MPKVGKKIERVQTGVRIEKRVLQVLKAVAAHREMGLGELIEGIALYSFEGKPAFRPETLEFIDKMRDAYNLELRAEDSHNLYEDKK
ncbi:MAG: hypothetical protein JJ879_11730 [Sneathiella sp.]|nr:hypothetical protein [Sneathiella sp.]